MLQRPLSSAAVAVIGLNVEPVGPALWIARLRRGSPLATLVRPRYVASEIGLVKMHGSNVGYDPIAYTPPVTGFIATTESPSAPALLAIDVASACWPTRCRL